MTTRSAGQRVQQADFPIEYYAEGARLPQRQRTGLESRLRKLASRHRDISGASIAVELVSGDNRRAEYRARLVLYCKPANIAATHKSHSVTEAATEAMEAVERQMRSQRERMRERSRAQRAS
ncbi:MAG: HPF/RaiA family ribosome-associated protein [Bacteroidota bacterium]|nr:HPF/RaiA family ribosome-associated protein [Bacteroidota bacterium]MDE2958349.1 HPF/RaiA family ribosome-associated protein [Bacteroidota bacterium]